MVGCGLPTRLIRGQRERGSRGHAEAVQDAVQAVGELLIQRVVQVGTTTAVLGYSRAGSIWYITQVAASSTTACAGPEELPWGGGRLIIVTAVYGSQSGPRGGSDCGTGLHVRPANFLTQDTVLDPLAPTVGQV